MPQVEIQNKNGQKSWQICSGTRYSPQKDSFFTQVVTSVIHFWVKRPTCKYSLGLGAWTVCCFNVVRYLHMRYTLVFLHVRASIQAIEESWSWTNWPTASVDWYRRSKLVSAERICNSTPACILCCIALSSRSSQKGSLHPLLQWG